MTRLLRDIRLVPIVLMAIICLFALKTFGLIFDGGYTLNDSAARGSRDVTGSVGAAKESAKRADVIRAEPPKPPAPKRSWAQEMLGYPDATGAVAADKPEPPLPDATVKENRAPAQAAEPPKPAVVTQAPRERPISPAERALLERLGERRAELDARARDLEMRENMLMAAEKRLEARVNELKEIEARIGSATQAKSESEVAKFKNIVTMYENMKAKDAAKIFDRLDMRVLVEVALQINPRRMSDIMAQMAPEAAERLTIELAARSKEQPISAELPKIEGRSGTN